MQIFGHDPSFWIAVGGAALFKLATSRKKSARQTIVTFGAAMFSAWVFTEPALAFMGWDAETYKVSVAAAIALSGESLMRGIMTIDVHKLAALVRGHKP